MKTGLLAVLLLMTAPVMTVSALAAPALAAPALATDGLFALYAGGRYEDAMRAGAAAGGAADLAIAARAALADAAQKPEPCLDCLRRAEAFARRATAADPRLADGHVWLAVSLGLEARITGALRARLRDTPGEARAELAAALKADPRHPYALAALGGWNIEITRAGGPHLANWLYGASPNEGLSLFDRAVKAAPENVAVRYQIALSLSGYDPQTFRDRIASELEAALRAAPTTAYEKLVQARAADLLSLLKKDDRDAFDAKVRLFQGYPP